MRAAVKTRRGLSPKQALAVLVAGYPSGEKISEETVRLYVAKLEDIDPALLAATVDAILSASRFFPSLAEIRQTAARLAGVVPMPAEQAAAIVRSANRSIEIRRRDGSAAYTEHVWEWPESLGARDLATIRLALSSVGDPLGPDERPVFGWERGFQSIYERIAQDVMAHALEDLSHAALPVAGPVRPTLILAASLLELDPGETGALVTQVARTMTERPSRAPAVPEEAPIIMTVETLPCSSAASEAGA